jgi:hypothetical protein
MAPAHNDADIEAVIASLAATGRPRDSRGTSAAGPTLAIQPSKVTRNGPLAGAVLPKINLDE